MANKYYSLEAWLGDRFLFSVQYPCHKKAIQKMKSYQSTNSFYKLKIDFYIIPQTIKSI
jgi:hypothetical protein